MASDRMKIGSEPGTVVTVIFCGTEPCRMFVDAILTAVTILLAFTSQWYVRPSQIG